MQKSVFLTIILIFLSYSGIIGIVVLIFSPLLSLFTDGEPSNYNQELHRASPRVFQYKWSIATFSGIAALLEFLQQSILNWNDI